MNPQQALNTLIPAQGASYYTLRLWRDCSTNKFQYTSFLKFESHNNSIILSITKKYTCVLFTKY
jgi:hypothetical protein